MRQLQKIRRAGKAGHARLQRQGALREPALGEQRAAAVRDYLVSLGLPAARVTIVSKGEEQPFCNEEAESCYSLNRRGHFLITAK